MTIKQYNYYTKLKSHVNMHVEIFFIANFYFWSMNAHLYLWTEKTGFWILFANNGDEFFKFLRG